MSNRRPIALALLASFVFANGPAWAAGPQKGLVPGYFDAKTGTFVMTAMPAPVAEVEPQAQATYTGILSMKFVITIKSSIPQDWTIYCTQTASVIDVGGLAYTNNKVVAASRSGNTASCLINMPYSWLLNGAGGSVYSTYMVSAYASTTALSGMNDATGTLAPITIPANGATTSRTVNVTL